MSPASLLLLLIAAPVLEELVFRAGLHEQLLRGGWRPGTANAATALAFAAAHLATRPGPAALATALPALAIGRLYGRRRRTAPCVAAHAACNALWIGLAALAPAAAQALVTPWNGALR